MPDRLYRTVVSHKQLNFRHAEATYVQMNALSKLVSREIVVASDVVLGTAVLLKARLVLVHSTELLVDGDRVTGVDSLGLTEATHLKRILLSGRKFISST